MQADHHREQPFSDENEAAQQTTTASRATLYVLPALIVLLCLFVWLMLARWIGEDYDAHELVREMRQPDRRSWQNAYTLSRLLQNPEYAHLRDDATLCRALTETLSEQSALAERERMTEGSEDPERNRFRVFLCRALGEFRVPEAWPPLLACATEQDPPSTPDPGTAEIRLAAFQAIAVLAGSTSGPPPEYAEETLAVLRRATRFDGSEHSARGTTDIPAAATFALGVVGGEQAIEHLLLLLDDPRADVRYNAATGLARHGRQQAVPALLEMLDPDNTAAPAQEVSASARARKQVLVWSTAIRATDRLLANLPARHRRRLATALEQLAQNADVPARVRIDAQQVLLALPNET